jgi:hypothetical protein
MKSRACAAWKGRFEPAKWPSMLPATLQFLNYTAERFHQGLGGRRIQGRVGSANDNGTTGAMVRRRIVAGETSMILGMPILRPREFGMSVYAARLGQARLRPPERLCFSITTNRLT